MPCEIFPLNSRARDAVAAVRKLGTTCAEHDGVAPFNEASLLALDTLETHSPGSGSARGFVAVDDGIVVGAALDAEGDGSSIDLAVLPGRRREGIGSMLLQAVLDASPEAAFWAHGSSAAAASFAEANALQAVRSLWVMSRDVAADETFDTALPDGLSARTYDGSDAQARSWLQVNAAAFASHPEQGRMTFEDFSRRRDEPWFDADGLILVWDESTEPATLAASHWTKREPDEDVGEVYVVAVAPEYQGKGIARPLTNLGLQHLARTGARRVDLYVEGDNEPAKAAYRRAGFEHTTGDTMYTHNCARSEGSTGE